MGDETTEVKHYFRFIKPKYKDTDDELTSKQILAS